MFHFAATIFHKPAPRHALTPVGAPARGVKFPPLKRGFMAQRPDFTDPSGLRGLSATDGFTVVMPAVDTPCRTQIFPAAVPLPPSQQPHDTSSPWSPPVSSNPVPVTALRRTRHNRRVLTELPPRTAAPTAEDSYESLAAYAGPLTHRAALNAEWFHKRASDESSFDASLRAFFDRWGALPKTHDRARVPGALDTEVFATVATGQFSTSTEGRDAR